ncbi:choice-of-anchor W domain-containing protein [Halorussus ruber]|uniref:choice-of-anchor W domain-containing protein n=1 Tax=Halorussus ruber TaxID=1126238 RepID=UPI00109267FA|nr:choice-of-anchor W domain-containing protein [Halorussus ruber]
MTDDDNFGLSRRKVLGSIGTIGIAAGGIGASTWAGYTDDEVKQLSTHAGSLDLRIGDERSGPWRNGPIRVKLGEISPGDTVKDTEYLKNVGQTDGACLGMRISNVKSREGKTPDAETDTDHSNGGELDDQIKIGGKVKDVETGEVLAHIPRIPFRHARRGMVTILGDDGVLLQKNGGNKLKLEVGFYFPHREDNNEAMKDSLTFDLDLRLYQKCDIVDRGTGFVKVSENFNENETKSGYARARYGDGGGSTQTWEVAVGNDDNVDDQGQYDWTSGEEVPFKFEYSGFDTDEATFTLDGTSVSTSFDNNLNGRIGIQGKADEATVQVHDATLHLKGPKKIVSNIDLTASNDDASNGDTGGRALNYLVANTSASDLADGFTIEGMAEVTIQDDFPGGDEDVALDVVLE